MAGSSRNLDMLDELLFGPDEPDTTRVGRAKAEELPSSSWSRSPSRASSVMPEVSQTSAGCAQKFGPITFRLPPFTRAGKVLQHCVCLIDRALALHPGCVVFKVGVTVDPARRFYDKAIGYAHDRDFENMLVLCSTETSEAIGFVEAALILKYRLVPGCRNIAEGGENVPKSSRPGVNHYCYLVYRVLPRPP